MHTKKRFFTLILVCFLIMTLPLGALAVDAEDIYRTIEVTMTGGSGRASISSPALIEVTDGVMYATIEWSSPYYEYMIVDDVKYLPVQEEGNSTFIIPIILDEEMPVSAQTVAMSTPHEIDYTLTFDSSTIKYANSAVNAWQIVYMLIGVVALALILIAIGLTSKRRKREKE